ncbi:response regulator [Bacteroides ovatus]|nr:response regulator [Bacteroides ovatus]
MKKNTASIHIVINPPIWATWYAKSLYTLLILCIIYLIFRSYKKRLLLKSSLKVEKNSLEMEKRNRQKEQELHNERLRFYTNIAHELRTPLTLIIGPLEDLKDNKGIPAAFRTKIQTIYRSAVQLLNLINQLMEFRKTETQNRQLTVGKGNLSNLITEIGLRYKELNQNEHVRINVKVEPVQENIYFDADIITIILNNLLSNAIKYTRAGHITLSMHRIKANGISYVEMIVADTGYGIDAESLPHIYDRYYQAKGKHQASGTGIGLALVKSLVDLHHGSLEVESAVEKGTTFRFRIQTDYNYPEALHKEEKVVTVVKEMAEDAEPESAFPILLVVEDNADIREYIANELQDTYKILQANNGKEGLILALRYTPNIIVSDIMMPEMDGIAMCKGIKENMNTSHIPVILLTAKDSIQDKEEGYDSGADSYLTKPFSAKLLRSRIKNLLEMRKRLARQIVENVPSTVVKNTEKRQSTSSPHPQLNRLDEAFLSKLTSLIEDNLDVEKIDTAFMIDCMNMSYSAFYRKVKALTELSPNEFVRKIKLRNSAHLLLTGEHNVSEAASMTGFNNMAHFRDCFKKEYGIPPSEYQKRYRQG